MCHGPPWQQPARASCIGPVVTAQYPAPRNSHRTGHLLRDLELAYSVLTVPVTALILYILKVIRIIIIIIIIIVNLELF
jgi:hypothetical protein